MHEPIKVLIVDPHPAIRRSLRAALELEDGVHVAVEAGDMLAALRLAADAAVTSVIVDGRVANLTSQVSLDALQVLARRVPVVVMGMGDPGQYASAYVAAGATGYWAKYDEVAELVGLLRAAVDRRRQAA